MWNFWHELRVTDFELSAYKRQWLNVLKLQLFIVSPTEPCRQILQWKTLDNKHLGFIFVVFFSIFTEIENLNNKKIKYNTIVFQFVTTWITEEDKE